MDYVTTSEPSLTRTLQVTRVVPIALPVEINIEDFFRGTRFVSAHWMATVTDAILESLLDSQYLLCLINTFEYDPPS